ncbi:MAG: Lrp/AsnC family transcriptional regulator [Eubacteriales bacterium]
MNEILRMLQDDARLTPEQIAIMTQKDAGDVRRAIEEYEKSGVIVGYQALIDWDKTDREFVSAVIELKITPQKDRGFDRVAEKIYNYPEVQSLFLMSGAYDLQVILEGKTLKEVAHFVAAKLSTIEAVTGTATHFVLRKYKDHGVIYKSPEIDERSNLEK